MQLTDHITVEIHPRHSTSRRGKFSFRKGIQVFPSQTGQDNEGFQEDGEQGSTLSQGQDLYAYPWDKSSLKSIQIDLMQFKELDAYASEVNASSSVENLVRVLLQKANSDLEKVRAIWMWICHHIEYDVEGYHNKAKRSCEPANVLQSGKSVCAGYAALFEEMCSLAGIQCKKLSGYSKGYEYKPGKVFKESNHAWNAVYLDQRWHLIDSTWGSGHVGDSCSKFTFRYDEFYFLTHPALFINDHFPEDHKWQLLKHTLTLQQFECKVRYRSEFYLAGLIETSTDMSVIETEDGKAAVFIESRSPTLFLCELNGAKEHCLMTLQRNGMNLEVYPPRVGTHSLDIYAKSSKAEEETYHHVLEYSLKCSSVDKSIAFPRALIHPVGPNWYSEEKGILGALPASPVIHTDDGRCVITFTRSKDLDFFTTLDSDASSTPEDIRRRHIWKTCQGTQVELKIHLPHAGAFALHIWAKKASDPGSNHCALSYLLSCPNKNVRWPAFPMRYTNWEDGYELVAPLAGVLPANRNVQFKLKLPGVDEVSVECRETLQLTLSGDGFWEGACSTSGGSKVTIRVSKNCDKTLWSLLKYKVESH
ncbi:kyphoscoliosis peptidase-like [Rhineura floridana]|uniref:kyphoscoliosis peptidase-like n=1 Tax=Rhineura floridana TaxID=261503 RepID=UPI002AC80F2E|nr:kyphoscoliosis peptidase-like [Rhineura floridana]